MRHPAHVPSARALVVAILALLVVAGCQRVLGPREWSMSGTRVDGTQFTIRVRDTSGRIENVEIDPQEPVPAAAAITNPPGEPNVVVVPWTGEECDHQTEISIQGKGAGLAITIANSTTATECSAVGVPHQLRITGSGPLPAGAVQVRQGPAS